MNTAERKKPFKSNQDYFMTVQNHPGFSAAFLALLSE